MRGLVPPDIGTLQNFNVNLEGAPVALWWPIYDYATYPHAGYTGQTLFFQIPIGQGGKTLEDTNLRSPGRMPTPVNMMITGIEMVFRSGFATSSVNQAALTATQLADINAVHGARMSFVLRVGDVDYLEEAPIGVFPQQFKVQGLLSNAGMEQGTPPAGGWAQMSYANFGGPMYQITPIRLISNQEFSVTINSPALVPLPSGTDGRWGVRLHGYRYRLAQ